jgi:hypothetical protein
MKEKYVELIDQLNIELPLLETLKQFIENYDKEFDDTANKLFLGVIMLATAYEKTKADARLLNDVIEQHDQKEEDAKELFEKADKESDLNIEDIIVPVTSSETEETGNETQ